MEVFRKARYSFSAHTSSNVSRKSQIGSPAGALNYKIVNVLYSDIVDQLLSYYSAEAFIDTPTMFQFVYRNRDVVRKTSFEMFVSFWEFSFEKYFIGTMGSFIPRVELNGVSLSVSQSVALGKIVAHGFYLSGYLPVNGICKASLMYCMTGNIPSDNVLLESYLKTIHELDRQKIEEALIFINSRHIFSSKSFPKEIETELLEFFHESGLKAIPRPDNLKQMLLKSAVYYCIQRPFFVLSNMRLGVVRLNPNWENLSEEMALVFLANCHSSGQCQPLFCEAGDSGNLSDDGANSSRSVRSSSSSSLFRR